MSERAEVIMPGDEQQVLGQIIDKMGSEKPDLAEVIRLCAIPHWFNNEIVASLRSEGSKPSERTESILDELKLTQMACVRSGNLFLHDNVRNLLLQRWRTEKPEVFQELNGRAAAYYEDKLRQSLSADEQRAEWEREEMYHLLVSDKERGIDRFKNLCNKAIYSYRLSTLDLLFSIASEQAEAASAEIQHWIQFFQGKKDQVSSGWEKAIQVWEKLKEKRAFFTGDLEPTLAVHLSILYKDKGKWSKAIECLDDSLKTLDRKNDERGMITILNNRGFLFKDKSDLSKARNDFQRGLEIARKIKDERGEAASLKNLGLLYKDKENWDEALEHFGNSLMILKKIGDERGAARAYDDRGLLYKDRALKLTDTEALQQAQENFRRAEDDFQHALEIFERIGDEDEKATALNSLGLVYKDRGLLFEDREDLQKAENNFQRARAILEKIGDQRRMADIFSSLGFLYTAEMKWHHAHANFELALANFELALTNFGLAFTILDEMRDERGKAVILHSLGLLYKHKGEGQQAMVHFQRSLDIAEKIGDEMNAATTMYELACLYDATEKYDQAIELLEKVVEIINRVGHPGSRIRKASDKLEMVKAKARSSKSATD